MGLHTVAEFPEAWAWSARPGSVESQNVIWDGCLKVGVVVTAVEFVQNLPDRLVFAIHEVWITCGETLGFHPHSCAGLRAL